MWVHFNGNPAGRLLLDASRCRIGSRKLIHICNFWCRTADFCECLGGTLRIAKPLISDDQYYGSYEECNAIGNPYHQRWTPLPRSEWPVSCCDFTVAINASHCHHVDRLLPLVCADYHRDPAATGETTIALAACAVSIDCAAVAALCSTGSQRNRSGEQRTSFTC